MIIGITIVLLAVVAAVFGLVRSHLMARSNERLAMIQAGLDIDDFERKRGNNPILLHLAIVILSISIGIGAGGVFSAMSDFRYSLLIFLATSAAGVIYTFGPDIFSAWSKSLENLVALINNNGVGDSLPSGAILMLTLMLGSVAIWVLRFINQGRSVV